MKKLTILVVLVSFLIGGSAVYSQETPPSQVRNKRQTQTTKQNADSKGDQGKTDLLPPGFKKIEADSAKHKIENYTERHDNSPPDIDWKFYFDLLLVIFTGILSISTIFLWWHTRKIADITNQSIELTRQEFIASHPPKLRVHSMSVDDPCKEGEPCKIQCFITNIGGSEATIIGSNLTFRKIETLAEQQRVGTETLRRLPPILPLNDHFHAVSEKPIMHGESILATVSLDERTAEEFNRIVWYGEPDQSFYLYGYVDYIDGAKTARRIAFCRQFSTETGRFIAVQDDDHEYSY